MSTKRFALTPLEKLKICEEREKPGKREGEMKLTEFCKLFPRPDGKPMATSTMSDILKQAKELLANPPSGADALKKKSRKEQFPLFEKCLVDWIEEEIDKIISDDVIVAQARRLIQELEKREDHTEDYTGFGFSDGWLEGFKFRNGLGRQRTSGDAGSTYPALVKPAEQKTKDTPKKSRPLGSSTTIGRKMKRIRVEKRVKARIANRKGLNVLSLPK